jgi:hypothetical protein
MMTAQKERIAELEEKITEREGMIMILEEQATTLTAQLDQQKSALQDEQAQNAALQEQFQEHIRQSFSLGDHERLSLTTTVKGLLERVESALEQSV